ncbi:hypothetical protein BUALT_Bualt18G0119100 [Buddleja alternifolia]|uniref:Two-component response regulator n=1 Tax=Buddleja alternifolia TaxID=168488 RepID=A0AAV6WCY9_9LAMI|nr:hypothetical protein BUALT_Bualt18G0119100 [Buddleja alternifolia]
MKVEENNDEFPAGMKVLVVDDNPQILETQLCECQYHVISTSSTITTMDILLENKNNFDLAIINVDMPNVDGFTLLQYVGLQMDLPVIMLSSHSDKELIMKGITHGACDYLIKPVRIEELNKIWQHVARRKKLNFNKRKTSEKSDGEAEALQEELNVDHNNKPNKKRKEENNEESNEDDEKRQHFDQVSSTNNKKTRLVWTRELHHKFVEAVNRLGVEKAVPKRILEIMNDKRLSRENVASHLQKYRLSLKKYSGGATHQANMGYGSSYPPTRALTRLNTPSEMNLYALSSPGIIQWHQPSDHDLIHTVDHHTLIQEKETFANWSSTSADSLTHDFSSKLQSFDGCNNGFPRSVQPISFCHDQAPSSGFSDNNTPTSNLSNQTFFPGNSFGVPHQEVDDQFFHGLDQFHANDEVFKFVGKHEGDLH